VAAHVRAGELDHHAFAARAALGQPLELVPRAHVGEEVAVPKGALLLHVAPAQDIAAANDLGLGVKVLAAGRGRRDVRVVEEEVGVGHDRHGQRQVVVVQQAHRLAALHIAELAVVVVWDQEHGVVLPLEAPRRRLAVAPDVGDAAAGDHVDHLVDGQLVGRQGLAGLDFRDTRLADALLAFELDERRVALALVPPAKLDRTQVADKEAAVDGNAPRIHPLVVGKRRARTVSQ
jgi:hypothetical protein